LDKQVLNLSLVTNIRGVMLKSVGGTGKEVGSIWASPVLYLVWQCYAYSRYKVQNHCGLSLGELGPH